MYLFILPQDGDTEKIAQGRGHVKNRIQHYKDRIKKIKDKLQ